MMLLIFPYSSYTFLPHSHAREDLLLSTRPRTANFSYKHIAVMTSKHSGSQHRTLDECVRAQTDGQLLPREEHADVTKRNTYTQQKTTTRTYRTHKQHSNKKSARKYAVQSFNMKRTNTHTHTHICRRHDCYDRKLK